jgi:hypothetical protein
MTAVETTVRALAAARYPWGEVWHHVAPGGRHYILCGPTRHAHVTLGGDAAGCDTPEAAWEAAETTMRREVADAIARERRYRDRADAEIARLTAALEVTP